MKKILAVAIAAVALAYLAYDRQATLPVATPAAAAASSEDAVLASAFEKRASGLQVRGQGTVTQVLADDNDGSRHQRFIVRLRSGQTVLMAHNIDLAPRIATLDEGDSVSFNGEYEWNPQGGVVHWTHLDPAGRHEAGWIRHAGRTYQ